MILPYSLKLTLLHALLTGERLQPLLEPLDEQSLLMAHRFVHEKAIEFGIRMRGRRFSENELLALIAAEGPRECLAQRHPCQLQECATLHRECMRNVALDQINSMADAIKAYLQLNGQP